MAKQIKNVLVVCPFFPEAPNVHPLAKKSIEELEWAGKLTYLMMRHDHKRRTDNVDLLEKMQAARDIFIAGKYDALLVIEADMVVPPHALTSMAKAAVSANADVVYGLYCSRKDMRWLAFDSLDGRLGHSLSETAGKPEEVFGGSTVVTKGAGFGCTLMKRNVLEAFNFRQDEDDHAPDWSFSFDCVKRGFKQIHDLGVVCGHVLSSDPLRVLWPTATNPYYSIEEFGRNFMANAGKYVLVKYVTFPDRGLTPPGTIVTLSAESAALLLKHESVVPAVEEADVFTIKPEEVGVIEDVFDLNSEEGSKTL